MKCWEYLQTREEQTFCLMFRCLNDALSHLLLLPQEFTYNSAISACEKGGGVTDLTWWEQTTQNKIQFFHMPQLRIVRTPGFCESLCWLVIGQSHLMNTCKCGKGSSEHENRFCILFVSLEALTVEPIHCDFVRAQSLRFTQWIQSKVWRASSNLKNYL